MGNITAAAKKDMVAQFVDNPHVALSHEYDDGFKNVVDMIKKNGRVINTGKSGPQVVALSNGVDPEQSNALLADAERRAKGENNF
jgi:hypothetical protein